VSGHGLRLPDRMQIGTGCPWPLLRCSRVRVAIIGLQIKIKTKSTAAFNVVFEYQAYMKLIFTKTP
jgi:hypothetical protein